MPTKRLKGEQALFPAPGGSRPGAGRPPKNRARRIQLQARISERTDLQITQALHVLNEKRVKSGRPKLTRAELINWMLERQSQDVFHGHYDAFLT